MDGNTDFPEESLDECLTPTEKIGVRAVILQVALDATVLGSAVFARSMPNSGTIFKTLAQLPGGSWKADLGKLVI